MANRGSVRGNRDGKNGENLTYTILGRGKVTRKDFVREIHSGKHPDYEVITVDGVEYARSKGNSRTNDNIDRP